MYSPTSQAIIFGDFVTESFSSISEDDSELSVSSFSEEESELAVSSLSEEDSELVVSSFSEEDSDFSLDFGLRSVGIRT